MCKLRGGGRVMVTVGNGVDNLLWGGTGSEAEEVLGIPDEQIGEQYATGTHSPSMAQAFLSRTSCPGIAGL